MFSLELPHRGDSNEYTQYTIFNIQKENHPKLSQIFIYGIFFHSTQERVGNSVGNEPSVFEPLKFYCIVTYTPKKLVKHFKRFFQNIFPIISNALYDSQWIPLYIYSSRHMYLKISPTVLELLSVSEIETKRDNLKSRKLAVMFASKLQTDPESAFFLTKAN